MWQLLLQAVFGALIATTTLAVLLYALFGWNSWKLLVKVARKVGPRKPPLRPEHRPIELIAEHARRLWRQSQLPERGRSRAKQIAIWHAYDHVLGEGCEALGFTHLLAILPPGAELDIERERIEDLLESAGLQLRQLS